ncbi:MAG TPA: hypothetical protein VGL38_13920 [bacterium]|jgi:tetratricopeptide (TPR) repeat protein
MKSHSFAMHRIASGAAIARIALFGLALAVLTGCASSRSMPRKSPASSSRKAAVLKEVTIPAGVDSGVAVAATYAAREVLVGWQEDSLAQRLYEDGRKLRLEGKPLRDAILKSKQSPQPVSATDTARSAQLTREADDAAVKGDKALGNKRVKDFTPEALSKFPEVERQVAAAYYEKARDLFEQALELNPWDQVTRDALLTTYEDLIDLHRSLNAVDAEISARQKYMDLYGERYGGLTRIARLMAEKGDTLQALLTYRRAEDALLTWAPLTPGDSSSVEPTGLAPKDYGNWLKMIQAECFFEMSLGLAQSALVDLRRLRLACRPGEDSLLERYAEGQLEWLGWDDGNIAASKLWVEFDAHRKNNEWDQARKVINDLLPILSNPTALFQMERWAATIDFAYLNQYESGLSRMRKLLVQNGFQEMNSNLDSLLKNEGRESFVSRMSAQRKTASTKVLELLDDYGGGCLTYGWEIESQTKDRERAYIYYYQAALVPSQKQAQALSYLADMSKNQPDRAILYGETALQPDLEKTLDPQTRGSLYQTLREAYRRKNDRAHTEYYFQALQAAVRNGGAKP